MNRDVAVSTPRRSVNSKLLRLFVVWWAVVAFHLLVLDRHEVWPHGSQVIAVCAAPPISPIVLTVWHKGGMAAFSWLVTAVAVAFWVWAARQPQDRFLLMPARVAISLYWLIHWFMLGLGV